MKIHEDWMFFLKEEFEKNYYKSLLLFLKNEINNGKIIYPEQKNWLNVLSVSPKNNKVIIIGQDPYHGENQAHGYSFSVQNGVKVPPSLKNIYKEISSEFVIDMNMKNGELTPLINQGVMLLNSILTVEKSKPGSHKNIGWEQFTTKIIEVISKNFSNKVFLLWGNYAIEKASFIDKNKHLILTSPHPSPFSAYTGFFGNNHFKLTNEYLISNGDKAINWQIK